MYIEEDGIPLYQPKMSSSTFGGSSMGRPHYESQQSFGMSQRPQYESKQSFWVNVSEQQLVAMSSMTSLTTSTLGRKPIRQRGEPRTVAPPFWWSPKQWFLHELWSWRFYVWVYAALAAVVVVIHVIALGVIAATHPFDGDRATVTTGSCNRIIATNRYVHWFTSVFGTGYLSASAYVMYCLTGPTRQEIDRAHAKSRWLDIGVLSMRNVFAVSRKRAILWLLLGLSSPVVQFFYNAMVFVTYSLNSYDVFVAQESFLASDGLTWNLSQNSSQATILNEKFGPLITTMWQENDAGLLKSYKPGECLEKFSVPMQSAHGNVILITNNSQATGIALLDLAFLTEPEFDVFDIYHAGIPTEDADSSGEQYMWMCDQRNSIGNDSCLYQIDNIKGNTKNWTVSDGNRTIDYCLVQETEEQCKLQVSLLMSIICIGTITFKVLVMFAVAILVNESPIMTTGDAIETFMKDPDPYTQGMCMASKKLIETNPNRWPRAPLFIYLKKWRWAHGITTRVVVFCLVMTISLCLNAALFATVRDAITIPNFFSLGIGQINRNFFIGWAHREPKYFIQAVFLANVGHAVFGVLYIIYNNVFYAMTFSWEWARYAHHRKGLRVSEAPRGDQRAVYFFLMPLKLAIPIMVFSMGIHTLVSQTLFIVDVETYGWDDQFNAFMRTKQWDFTTTGFSPLGNALLIIAGALMISYLLCCAGLELKSTMPVTSTCSAAISAACHPDEFEPDDFYLRKCTWGVTSVQNGVGHATFTCLEAEKPNENTPYA